MYCHGPVGTTELVVYREVKCIVSFKRGSTVYISMMHYNDILLHDHYR